MSQRLVSCFFRLLVIFANNKQQATKVTKTFILLHTAFRSEQTNMTSAKLCPSSMQFAKPGSLLKQQSFIRAHHDD
jgi:hypothetical protein